MPAIIHRELFLIARRTCWRAAHLSVLTIAFSVAVNVATGHLPHAQLNSVFPPGGRAGTEVAVAIRGKDLDRASQLLFSHTGIRSTPRVKEAEGGQADPQPVINEFLVSISAEVPPGVYELRAVGRFGASNPRAFVVGTEDEVVNDGTQPNDSPENALVLNAGTTASGRTSADQMDFYRIAATKGQRILVDCFAQRIDSRLDATLVLYAPDGRELQRVRDTFGRDPMLDLLAQRDGDYLVGVYDFLFRGGDDYCYRLTAHTNPRIEFLFPPAGLPGSNDRYTLYGHNLPNGSPVGNPSNGRPPLEKLELNIAVPGEAERARREIVGLVRPAESAIDGHVYRLKTPQGISNAVMLGFAKASVVVEQEPNNKIEEAQEVNVPCEYVGQFHPGGDRDWLSFTARKGETYWIEVISHRLGAGTDPFLLVQQVKTAGDGQEQVSQLAALDDTEAGSANPLFFDTRSKDPVYKLVVDDDATYRVMVRDLYNTSRGDPRYIYRLAITSPQPDFRLVAYPPPIAQDKKALRPSATVLRRGGTTALKVEVLRRHGFDGSVEISAEGLPPGVACPTVTIGGGNRAADLIFAAADDAQQWAKHIRIAGRAEIDGKQVVRHARGGTVIWETKNHETDPVVSRMARTISLAVLDNEAYPASVKVGDGSIIETSKGGKTEIPVKLIAQGVQGEVKLRAQGLPAHVHANEVVINGADGKLELSFTNQEIQPGTYTFYLGGQVQCQYVRDPDAQNNGKPQDVTLAVRSTPVQLQIAAAPVAVRVEPAAAALKAGDNIELAVSVERQFGFDDQIELSFEPPETMGGVSGQPINIEKGQTTGKIALMADQTAAAGEYVCRIKLRIRFNDVMLDSSEEFRLTVTD